MQIVVRILTRSCNHYSSKHIITSFPSLESDKYVTRIIIKKVKTLLVCPVPNPILFSSAKPISKYRWDSQLRFPYQALLDISVPRSSGLSAKRPTSDSNIEKV